jgi:photosystem II stability/assembly factor-like uncharacterized protein
MRRLIINFTTFSFIFLLLLSISGNDFVESEVVWSRFSNGIKQKQINCILVDSKDPEKIFIGTEKAVYLSMDRGRYYRKILNISGKNSCVNLLVQDNSIPAVIYAATANGLYRSNDYGKHWRNIFKGRNKLQRYCNAVLVNQNKIYLATKEGLFFSFDNARTWNRTSGVLGNIEIKAIARTERKIYLATIDGIYSLDLELKTRDKLYSVYSQKQENNDEDNNDYNSDEIKGIGLITDIKIDLVNSHKIYFSSDQGLFLSHDAGKTWSRFNLQGLLSKNIKTILLDSKTNRIFVGTDKGVFEFYQGRWHQLYKGIISNKINYLATDSLGKLWAATGEGVFVGSSRKYNYDIDSEDIHKIIEAFRDEPTIQEIQKEAIKYAEVQPQKIIRWRRQAMLAAFMPTISLDYDKNVYGSASTKTNSDPLGYGTAMVGPRDWGLSLSWDLSELIWNPDQTSIDSRSKLMVELREDILDEITRLYFERRRLQTEFLISPPEEAKERLDKFLRLEELTASIDALTGGYFSRELENRVK